MPTPQTRALHQAPVQCASKRWSGLSEKRVRIAGAYNYPKYSGELIWFQNIRPVPMPPKLKGGPFMAFDPLEIRISLQKLLTGLILIIVPLSVVGLYLTFESQTSLQGEIGMYV